MRFYDEEDEERLNNPSEEPEVDNNASENNVPSQVGDKLNDKLKKDLAKKAGKTAATKGSLAASLGPILFWVAVVIVALIIIVGIIMFFMTMPGMVMEKLKELGEELAKGLSSWFGYDDTAMIEEESIYGSLNYLEEMGYDLKGFGFLTEYKGNKEDGVIRDSSGKITDASSDFITAYLISDNYVYTIANHNIVTGGGSGLSWLGNRFEALGLQIKRFFGGEIGEQWLRGLLYFYNQGEEGVGDRGGIFSDEGFLNFDILDIDPVAKTLTVGKSNIFDNNKSMTYSLDGWTGRYGMPIDFLLAVHIATMMPDLAYDMANSFETKINIILQPVTKASIDAAYYTGEDYIDYSVFEGNSNVQRFLGIFNTDTFTNKEAKLLMMIAGIKSPEEFCSEDEICYDGTKVENATIDMVDSGVCDDCKAFIQKIMGILKEPKDAHYEYYIPYIESVEDHWYRNVYFAVNDDNQAKEFIKLDYDYEIMMKERWTMYETYPTNKNASGYVEGKAGEFVLYEVYSADENPELAGQYKGNIYEGTAEQAKDEGILVAKKAITVDAGDSGYLKDVGWTQPEGGGIWSAYKSRKNTTTSWKRAYKDSEIVNDDEMTEYIKEKIYTQIQSTGTITQKGEGQRSETNSKIKKMFLANTYFRYDGNKDTAEIITKMRQKIATHIGNDGAAYGPLNEIDAGGYTIDYTDKMLTSSDGIATVSDNFEGYKFSDYSGQVTLNQDSLNAFSMLENTHTLDSDYIYRDFKELVVELGYFTKEELADESPKLLQWLVPETGCVGYPERSIDKRENEYGTMVHSKGDIDANKWNTIVKLLEETGNEVAVNNNLQLNPDLQLGSSINSSNQIDNAEINVDVNTMVGAGAVGDTSITSVTVDEFLEATREMCEYINDVGYDYCVCLTGPECATCSQQCKDEWESNRQCLKHQGICSECKAADIIHCAHVPHNNECALPINFEVSKNPGKNNMCCATLVSWALQNVGVMADTGTINGAGSLGRWIVDVLGGEVIEYGDELKPGDIMVYGTRHIDILGEESGGGFVKFTGGAYTMPGASEGGSHSCITSTPGWTETTTYAIRLFTKEKEEPKKYEGYEGDEGVVSPVTGILLEYGTYNSQNIDSISGEEYRVNVDLKYGPLVIPSSETFESENVYDKVGYAKILVLDTENYLKLESGTNNSWKYDSLINEDGSFRDTLVSQGDTKASKILDGWSDIDKTVYAYKEFLELYDYYGIAGYTVYIDGFVCELPDEGMREDENRASKIPSGDLININKFKEVTPGNLNLDSDQQKDTLYETPKEYKVASKSATEKLEAEEKAKEEASVSLYTNDLIFIKEGTVIGRTMTDKELLEASYFRNGQYGTYDEKRTGEPKDDEVIGNYLRIIMRDLDGTPVEDVEDFMKIPEPDPMDDVIMFMAGVLTAEAGGSGRGAQACAWVIRNRLDGGRFQDTLAEILVAENQFTVVNKDPAKCSGWIPNGELISLTVNGVTYYVAKPIDEAIEIARGVWNDAFPNEIGERCFWKSADTSVADNLKPIQIPEGSGNKFHYGSSACIY